MSEWTTERLDALPEKTMVLASSGNPPDWMYLVKIRGAWWVLGYPDKYQTDEFVLYFELSTVRVVSVPINALLDEETQRAVAWRPCPDSSSIRAAIDHVTGDPV